MSEGNFGKKEKKHVVLFSEHCACTGELWGVYCEDFSENWPHYNGTALYQHELQLFDMAPDVVSSEVYHMWFFLRKWAWSLNRLYKDMLLFQSQEEGCWISPNTRSGHIHFSYAEMKNLKYCQGDCHIVTGDNEVVNPTALNSLDPGKFEWNFRYVIFERIWVIDIWGIYCRIALIWIPLGFTGDQSTLVQNQRWPRSPTPYGITRPQWVKDVLQSIQSSDWSQHAANLPSVIYRLNMFS